jgi:hypothetical protein
MLAIVMIIGGALLRLLPHLPNFAPITAMGLFGGKYIGKRFAIFVPLVALIISDYLLLYINPFEMKADFTHVYPITMLFHGTTLYVWGSFVISSFIGIALRKTKNPAVILAATGLASLQFFLITNFGVWFGGTMYSKDIAGLMECYAMGLPFFKWTLMGDLFYTGVFFGSYILAKRVANRATFATPELLQN